MGQHKTFRLSALGAIALMMAAFLAIMLAPSPLQTAAVPREQWLDGSILRDVTYCMGGKVALKMDVYLPPGKNEKPAPALIYVHGGGWTAGDKSWVNRILNTDELTARGYVVASINYRLAPMYYWPAQLEDTKCAVRSLRAQAALYNLDPQRIGVWGESAGGHVVSMLGLAGSDAGFEGKGGYESQSSQVGAVVDMFGPTDFTGFDLNDPYLLGMSQLLLGVRPTKELLHSASPVSYVSKEAPPFLIFHGDHDPLVSPEQSQALYNRLREAGAPATLVTVENAGHVFYPTGGQPNLSMPEIRNIAMDFFDRTLSQEAKP